MLFTLLLSLKLIFKNSIHKIPLYSSTHCKKITKLLCDCSLPPSLILFDFIISREHNNEKNRDKVCLNFSTKYGIKLMWLCSCFFSQDIHICWKFYMSLWITANLIFLYGSCRICSYKMGYWKLIIKDPFFTWHSWIRKVLMLRSLCWRNDIISTLSDISTK